MTPLDVKVLYLTQNQCLIYCRCISYGTSSLKISSPQVGGFYCLVGYATADEGAEFIKMKELWRPIKGFPDYQISNMGRVMSYKRERLNGNLLQPLAGLDRYLHVNLCKNGHIYRKRIHRLVLFAFVGEPLPGQETRHLDGSRTNNIVTNLCWGTRSENGRDKAKHGIVYHWCLGEKSAFAKLNKSDVKRIRQVYAKENVTQIELAIQYGVARSTIQAIVGRTNWKHI